jgi:hypothetical protein
MKRIISVLISISVITGCLAGFTAVEAARDENGFGTNGTVLISYDGPGGDVVIPEGVTEIQGAVFGRPGQASITSITLPESLITIGYQAFSSCTTITSILIPAGVENIETMAFYSCSSLVSIDVSPENLNFVSVDGVLFDIDKTVLMAYPYGKDGQSYDIPGGVKAIEAYAFAGCWRIRSLTIPDGVTSVGRRAFERCVLFSLSFPDSLKTIGYEAFYACTIQNLSIGSGVETIDVGAFSKSASFLRYLQIPPTVTEIGEDAFDKAFEMGVIDIEGVSSTVYLDTNIIVQKDSFAHGWAVENDHPYLLDSIADYDNIGDVLGALRAVSVSENTADVNDDGRTDAIDVLLILKYVIHKNSTWWIFPK